jgi:S1-C subfamily serine protease
MNTAIISPSGASVGIGFAIPVDEINQIVPQLIRHGKVVRPRLGVELAGDQLTQQLGIDKGALILKIAPGSPAELAGLLGTRRDASGRVQLGDVIIAVEGHPVTNGNDLSTAIESYAVGSEVKVTILRDGKRMDVNATIQAAQ